MVRAIVWKEFREQGLIGLTLVVLGGGVLVAVAVLADPPQTGVAPGDLLRGLGPGPLTTLLLAVTAGTVCGGALFAAEREAGTHGFLDALPAARAGIWTAKLVAGGLLAAGQAGLLIAAGLALGLLATPGWGLAVAVYSMLAFCWGTLGSTLARTTLGSVGVAVPAATLFAFVYLFPIMLLFATPGTPIPRPAGAFLFLGLMFATPLLWSAVAYTRPDRAREADERVAPPPAVYLAEPSAPAAAVPVAARRSRLGVKALVWLSTRQLAGAALPLAGFATAAGLALLLPTIEPFIAWPALALLAGVFAGITAFSNEQTSGSARYWGEQRLPAGRMWLVKVLVHLLFALLLALLIALPTAVRAAATGGSGMRAEAALSAVFRSLMFEPRALGAEAWKYLLAPLGYGFAAGALCGMLFKKPVVGAGVAGVVGGTTFAAALPGLLAGGTRHLWLWLPPLLALAAGRAVLGPWAADRVATRRGLMPLIGGGVAVLVAVAAAAAFRAVEVPDVRGTTDDETYVKDGLISFQENETGRRFRAAAEQFAKAGGLPAAKPGEPPYRFPDMVDELRSGRYAGDNPRAGEWVQAVFDLDRGPAAPAAPGQPPLPAPPTWHAQARAAADPALPVAVFEHPQLTPGPAGSATLDHGRGMAVVLVSHGLYRQTAGDHAAFPPDLRTGLAVARSLRNGSITAAVHRGNDATAVALGATARWLARADDRPDLLWAVLDEVLRDERARMTRVLPDGTTAAADVPAAGWGEPFDPLPHQLADRYVVREQMKAPSMWLPLLVTPPGRDKDAPSPEVDLVAFAWSVPWERERTRRLVAYGLDAGNADEYRRLTRGRPGAALLAVRPAAAAEAANLDRFLRACRRGLAASLACRLYRHDHGSFPPDLAALVPAYLPAVPPDPYSAAGEALRYRVAADDELLSESTAGTAGRVVPAPTPVRAGQPVVWSVGPDGADGGGRIAPFVITTATRAADLVFVVPLPPGP